MLEQIDPKMFEKVADQRGMAAEYIVKNDPALAAVVAAMWANKHGYFMVPHVMVQIYETALAKMIEAEYGEEGSEAEKFWEGKL